MKTLKRVTLLLALAMLFGISMGESSKTEAGYHGRYYRSWTYYPTYRYHYTRYYYGNANRYHYCMYYPSYSRRYIYYYNPYRKVYWGRFDLEAKGDNVYSELAPKDRKKSLKDIPDKAFPKPGKMPTVPETDAKDDLQIKPLPKELTDNLPKAE